jgi:putative ABC transport system permease protein
MSILDILRFAAGALSGHRLRTALSFAGVSIGVAAVLILTGLGEGARRYVTDQFTQLGSNLLVIIPGKTETTGGIPGAGGAPNDLTLEDAKVILRTIPSVWKVAPFTMGTETVSYGERHRQIPVAGTTHDILVVRELEVAYGQFLPQMEWERGASVVVLGRKTARELFPGENPLGRAVRIGSWRMRVIGVMGKKGVQLGLDMDDVALIPVATAMRMFNRNTLYRVLIKVHAHTDLDKVKDRVIRVVAERHGEEDITCLTQDAVVSTFSSILTVLTLALAGIGAVSLSVAGVGIMNVMLVSVSERTSEVGLMKAVGAGRNQILSVFLAESVLIAASGGGLGLAAGWAGTWFLNYLYPSLQAKPPLWAVAAAIGISIGIGALFGVLPAYRATRLDPVSALSRR